MAIFQRSDVAEADQGDFARTADPHAFRSGMDALLGEGSCKVLRIRPQGGVEMV